MVEGIERAVSLHHRGLAAEAESAYRHILGVADARGPDKTEARTAAQNHIATAAYNNLATLLWSRQAHREAVACWRAAISIAPRSADAHGNLATAQTRTGHQDRAQATLRAAIAFIPDSSDLYVRLGTVLTSGRQLSSLPSGRVQEVVAIARAAVRISPGDAKLWHNLGLALVSAGDRASSSMAYRRAVALDPLSASNLAGLAATLPRAEAEATLRAAIALGPSLHGKAAAIYYNLGNVLQNGRYDAWRAAASSIASTAGSEAKGLSQQAKMRVAAAAARASAEATACFDVATAIEPTHADAYYNAALASQQAHADESDAVIAKYRAALRLAPTDLKVWSRTITTLQWAGRTSDATSLIDAAIERRLWQDRRQRPSLLVAGLAARPWHDTHGYAPLEKVLRSSHAALLDAVDAVSTSGLMLPQPEGLQEPNQTWEVFDVGETCQQAAEAANAVRGTDALSAGETGMAGRSAWQRLQPICRILAELRAAGAEHAPPYAPLKAQFSRMAAGVHVRPHTGPTNAKLTLHYGLRVPRARDGRPGARIRVADEVRAFVEGGLIAFDDSFEHEVWQMGDGERTTLVVHVAHPDLASKASRGSISSMAQPELHVARIVASATGATVALP